MNPDKSFLDTALKLLSLLGVGAILFIGGIVVYHYRLPPSAFMSHSFSAAEAWLESFKDSKKREKAKVVGLIKDNDVSQTGKIVAGKITWDKDLAYNGYTLLSYRYSTAVQLIDMEGNIVYRWNLPFSKIWPNPDHIHTTVKPGIFIETAHVFPNGDLLVQYVGIGDTPYGYGLAKVDKDGNVLWKYSKNAHHDFYIDRENNIYALTQELIFDPVKGLEDLSYPMVTDYIVKLTPDGKEIDKISILDALKDSPYSLLLYHRQVKSRKQGWDEFHTNTIRKLEPEIADKFPMWKPGSLLISMRSMNAIAVIDPDTRKVVWAYRGDWQWQHAARFLDNGNLLVLDNLGHFVGDKTYAKVVEFNPQTLATTWYYAGDKKNPVRSTAYGRLQRLPNGNTLIDYAFNKNIFEITPDKRVAWRYQVVNASKKNSVMAITTAERYPPEAVPFLKDAPPPSLVQDDTDDPAEPEDPGMDTSP